MHEDAVDNLMSPRASRANATSVTIAESVLTSLQKLELSGNPITDSRTLPGEILQDGNLSATTAELDADIVQNNSVANSYSALEYLCRAVNKAPQLEWLGLGECGLGPAAPNAMRVQLSCPTTCDP